MKISTGLVPAVEKQRWQSRAEVGYIKLGHASGSLPIPIVGEYVWVVKLLTAKDTSEFPKGTVQHVMVLGSERRGVKLSIPAEERGDFAARQREHARREHNIPDDAVVEEHWLGMFHLKEQVISWYELEV